MSTGRKLRREPARRYNAVDVAEIRRLAVFYEGIADDYEAAARMHGRVGPGYDPARLQSCQREARKARRWAAQLRGKVADR